MKKIIVVVGTAVLALMMGVAVLALIVGSERALADNTERKLVLAKGCDCLGPDLGLGKPVQQTSKRAREQLPPSSNASGDRVAGGSK